MRSGHLRIYVPIENDAILRQAEQRIRQETFAAILDAGITVPDIETDATASVVIDKNEEAPCQVRITLRQIPSGRREDVGKKVMTNLVTAGFDPHVVIEENNR